MLEVLETMGDLVKEGKIRHFGLSNETRLGHDAVSAARPKSSACRACRPSRTNTISCAATMTWTLRSWPITRMSGCSPIRRSPRGRSPASTSVACCRPERAARWPGRHYRNNQYTEPAIRAYIELAEKHGLDVSQMAIAFCLTKPFMTSVIIGATTMEQLKTDISAADCHLDEQVLNDIQQIFMKYPRTL